MGWYTNVHCVKNFCTQCTKCEVKHSGDMGIEHYLTFKPSFFFPLETTQNFLLEATLACFNTPYLTSV